MSEKTALSLRALLFAAFVAALFAGTAYADGCAASAGQVCDPNAPAPIGGGGTLESAGSPLAASMIKLYGCYCTPNMGLSCPRSGPNPKCCYTTGAPSGSIGNLATCYDATINAPRDDWCCSGLFCSSYFNTPEYGGYKCRACFKEGEGQGGFNGALGCNIKPSRCCAGSVCDTATDQCIYGTCHQEGVDCTNDATNGRQCCSGLFCYGQPSGPKSCISCIGAGGLCGAAYGGSTCCGGNKCVLQPDLSKVCKSCAAEDDGCTAAGGGPDNSLCCSGLTCTETDPINGYYNCKPGNNPPAAPAPTAIAALGGGNLLPDGQAQCIGNCPPSPLPIDPENNPVHMEYRWSRTPTGQPAVTGAWSATPSNFACSGVCSAGDSIRLQSRSCDSLNACSIEVNSAAGITVSAYPCSHETQTCVAPRACCTGESLACQSGTCTKIVPPPAPASINLNYFILAFVIVIALISLAFMASYVFSMPHWRPIIQDELLQVMVTAAVAVLLLSLQAGIDSELSAILAGTGNTAPLTMMQAAQNTLSASPPGPTTPPGGGLEYRANNVLGASSTPGSLAYASAELGRESSKSIFCNFMGVGFTLANCSPLNAYRGGLTVSAFTTTVALSDIYAQQFLLSLAANYAFNLLIPLGLFLRCFKVSRQAGGALIAIGFGFYTVFPAVVVATEKMLHGSRPAAPPAIPAPGTCDATETDVTVSLNQFKAYGNSLTNFDLTESTAYFVLVRVIFMSILNLIITLGFIRAFAHVIGSEIDVSALARIS